MISNAPGSANVNSKLIDYGFVNNYIQPDGKVISQDL